MNSQTTNKQEPLLFGTFNVQLGGIILSSLAILFSMGFFFIKYTPDKLNLFGGIMLLFIGICGFAAIFLNDQQKYVAMATAILNFLHTFGAVICAIVLFMKIAELEEFERTRRILPGGFFDRIELPTGMLNPLKEIKSYWIAGAVLYLLSAALTAYSGYVWMTYAQYFGLEINFFNSGNQENNTDAYNGNKASRAVQEIHTQEHKISV